MVTMTESEYCSILKSLQDTCNNNNCFDCHANDPKWISVNNGVFICSNCADKHRELAVHISFVRSIEHGEFKEYEIEFMKAGGNSKFQEFLESSDLDWTPDLSIELKYKTVAAHLYRDRLRTIASGGVQDEKNFSTNQIPFITKDQNDSEVTEGVKSVSSESASASSSQSLKSSNFTDSLLSNANSAINEVTSSAAWGSLLSYGQYVSDYANNVVDNVVEKANLISTKIDEEYIKPNVDQFKSSKFYEDVSTAMANTVETIATSTNKGVNSLWETVSSLSAETTTYGEDNKDSVNFTNNEEVKP